MSERRLMLLDTLSLDGLRERLQAAGYRIETLSEGAGAALLRSATGGVAFDIRPGHPVPDPGDDGIRYQDATLRVVLVVKGVPPLDLVNTWNNTRRFGRLHFHHDFLMLDMDISVAGGVSLAHLRIQIEIWDRLVHDLRAYLRDKLPRLTAINETAAGSVAAAAAPASPRQIAHRIHASQGHEEQQQHAVPPSDI